MHDEGGEALSLDGRAAGRGCGILWGVVVLVVALSGIAGAGYGVAFRGLLASFYPGYTAQATIAQAILVGVYAVIDGLIGGYVFAWLYNYFVPKTEV